MYIKNQENVMVVFASQMVSILLRLLIKSYGKPDKKTI